MSAIAALWSMNGARNVAADMQRMLATLAIYGPDRASSCVEGDVALGARLMAVLPEDLIDTSKLEDGEIAMVATARLDNRDELGGALSINPASAAGMTDRQLLFAAYRRWGASCLDRLLGDFSFAAWHRSERKLFCARDHLGQHPLVWYRNGPFFALASMPKGLFALADIPRTLNENVVRRHLRVGPLRVGIEPDQQHVFAGLHTLPGGHCLTVTTRGEQVRRYWQPDPARRLKIDDDECVETFRSLFDRAVACRLRAKGEVASQLSGGLDSAGVTVTAARQLAEEGRTMTAFTAAPREGYALAGAAGWPLDESDLAGRIVAPFANVDHVIVRPDGASQIDAIQRFIFLADRGPINPCNEIWQQQICADAKRRGVHVLLSGDIGNVTMSHDGYDLLDELRRAGRWTSLLREVGALPLPARKRLERLFRLMAPATANRINRLLRRRAESSHSALRPELIAKIDALDAADRREPGDGFASRVAALFRVDRGPFNAARAAGWGLDVRDPTADRRIVEFCLALPPSQYLRLGTTRWLARRAFADVLPAEMLDRRRLRRGAQAPDYHERIERSRDELIGELDRMAHSTIAARYIDLPRLRRLLEELPADGWRVNADKRTDEYRLALLRGLSMGRFIMSVEGGNG